MRLKKYGSSVKYKQLRLEGVTSFKFFILEPEKLRVYIQSKIYIF